MAKDNTNAIKVDTVSGSRSYNRLDMQVSQTLHMAIDLYDSLNYLLILDHYDDITLFDLDAEPLAVSYYQMKTSDDIITIDSAITEGWFLKLYSQLTRPEEWLVKELGLITNTPLEIKITHHDDHGKKHARVSKLKADHTSLTKLDNSIQDRIKADIAEKFGLQIDQVDLSKFAHLHTTLSIERHKDIVEKEIQDFLYEKYPRITVDTVKGIYSALIDILTKRQGFERMSGDSSLDDVKLHKGFSKTDFNRVVDKAIMLSIPPFEEVLKVAGVASDMYTRLSLPYTHILTDSNNNLDESFTTVYNATLNEIEMMPFDNQSTAWEYALRIGQVVHNRVPLLKTIYNEDYIAVLTICLLINKSRRTT